MSDIDVGSLFATDDTKTIYLAPASPAHPKGVWVTLKRQLDYGEKVAVEAALVKGLAPDEARQLATEAEQRGGSRGTILVDTGRQKMLKLAVWIADWNFPGPAGKTVAWPTSAHERLAVVASLSAKAGDWLEEQIDAVIAEADAVEQADAEDSGADPLGPSLAVVGREAT